MGYEANNPFGNTTDSITEGLLILNFQWVFIHVNAVAALQLQKKPEELIGRSLFECCPTIQNTKMYPDLKKTMDDRAPSHFEMEFSFGDGTHYWLSIFTEPHELGLLIRLIDISRQKAAEEKLSHIHKLETIGRLASGIAHDFNNKLAIIMSYSDLAINDLKAGGKNATNYLEQIHRTVHQSAAFTRQLLAFSRNQELEPTVINVNPFILQLHNSLLKLIGESISVKVNLCTEDANILLDRSQLDQILLNLSINAKEAMPDGGTLAIETSIASSPLNEPQVLITFRDSGVGIVDEVKEKIFEPFFSTKKDSGGTGLGLTTVYEITKKAGGQVRCESVPGKGTTFEISFPRVLEKEAAIPRPGSETYRSGNGETLLVIENESILREAYILILKKAGYNVLAASDATTALATFKQHQKDIVLVVSDIVLPMLNGSLVVDIMRKEKNDLKAIYISGSNEVTSAKEKIGKVAIFLQKPISRHDLLSSIQKTIGS